MQEPIMREVVVTIEDIATLLHALLRYYQQCGSATPQAGMLLVARLARLHGEMIQDEAQRYLCPEPPSGGLGA